jgi:predicted phage-related endonuclease
MAPIIIDSFPQRSEEWVMARCGNPGASSISKIITSTGAISKQREDYLFQLAAEIVAGRPEDQGYLTKQMQNGIDREDSSRAFFEMIYGVPVRQVGIVYKNEYKTCHCSPDGLVGENAGLEMKNPTMRVHVKALLDDKIPTEYFSQVQMCLYVCERSLWYFMSNSEGLPPLILEIKRDEPFIAKIEKALNDFNADLMEMVEKIKGMQ